MQTTDYELDAWLGEMAADLTDAQFARIADASDDIDARYPDADAERVREAALTAAVQYVSGVTSLTLRLQCERLSAIRQAQVEALAEAQQLAIMAHADGTSESQVARELGVERSTVRRWLGK